ncbi:formate dehydrogenase accessory protein [Streptomyces noursei ATCC 11455]|nr:formate dehydrogenase accessory protein [Streptomyces noursei ATCC 11455]
MGRGTARRRVLRLRAGVASCRPDTLAGEEPLEIRVGGRPLAVTMRTPGHDFDLAAGFLVSEGVLRGADDIAGIRYCAGATADGGNTYNVVDVVLAPGVAAPDASSERHVYTTSSCGLCGRASLDAVRTAAAWSVAEDPLRTSPEVLAAVSAPSSLAVDFAEESGVTLIGFMARALVETARRTDTAAVLERLARPPGS